MQIMIKSVLIAFVCWGALAAHAYADDLKKIDVPPGELGAALRLLAKQAGVEFFYHSEEVNGLHTQGVNGTLSAQEAVTKLLEGTALTVKKDATGAMLILSPRSSKPTASDHERESASMHNEGSGDEDSKPGDSLRPAQTLHGSQSSSSVGTQQEQASKNMLADLQEVVVTAQKRSERLQDVPLSITSVSAEALRQSGAQTIADIARQVPGLNVVSSGPGQNQLIIRGVSSGNGVPTPTVGYYVDDTPIQAAGSIAGAAMDPVLFDLERVEVLRGPQGTLYGGSSMGGTVRYITHQPDSTKTEGWVDAGLSDTEGGGFNYSASGLLNQPLIDSVAAIRVVGFYRDEDGYIDRYAVDPANIVAVAPGSPANNVNTEKTYGTRISLQVSPIETFTITPSLFLQRTKLGAPFTFDSPPGTFDHPIQTADVSEPITDQMELYALTIKGKLGLADITSSTAYRDRSFDAVEDESKRNFYLAPFYVGAAQPLVYPTSFDNTFNNHDFSEEIRAASSWGKWHALMGLFYEHQDNHFIYSWPITSGYNAAFGSPYGSESFFYGGTDNNKTTQRALFGEVEYNVTTKLKAAAGVRLFDINQSDHAIYAGAFNGGTTNASAPNKDSGVNPKFEFSYKASEDILTYISATKGFRQGGPQPGIPTAPCVNDLAVLGLTVVPDAFKSDSLWSYELGLKSAWLDRRLTVNVSAYYIEWNRVQQLVTLPTCGYSFTGNYGKASSKGLEAELRYEPEQSLLLTLGASYNEAKLLSTVTGAQGAPGDTLENSPRWAGSASVEYHHSLNSTTSGYARASLSATSQQFNSFDPTSSFYRTPGYALADVRAGIVHSAWDTSLFVSNAFDRHTETAVPIPYSLILPDTRAVALNRPRTIGLEVRREF